MNFRESEKHHVALLGVPLGEVCCVYLYVCAYVYVRLCFLCARTELLGEVELQIQGDW